MTNGDPGDDDCRRAELFNDLSIINGAIEALDVPCRVSLKAARLYPTADLPALVAAAHRQYLDVLYQLGGMK
jgi:hypothetical protein